MAHSPVFINQVWRKGKTVPGVDPAAWRKDQCGAWIRRVDYGNRNSSYGWEIDRIVAGGPYVASNCRPLQWQNNIAKSDGRLKCVVTAHGNRNVAAARTVY